MTKEISNKIREIINKYYPIRLLEIDCPKEEYDPEIKRILPILKKAISKNQLHNSIYKIFVFMFDKGTAGPKDNYRKLSEELFALTHKK